mgnify:CR=1 FL=1
MGVLCVEFFVLQDGSLVVNEIAPRPHNSGHYTIEACVTSQFENHLRAVVGLPLGSTSMTAPAAVMVSTELQAQTGAVPLHVPAVAWHVQVDVAAAIGVSLGLLAGFVGGALARLLCSARSGARDAAPADARVGLWSVTTMDLFVR